MQSPGRTSQLRRVAVLFNNAGGYSRNVIKGVTSFAASRPWQLSVEGVTESDLISRLSEFSGAIVQVTLKQIIPTLRRAGIPVVNVSSAGPGRVLPSVVSDDDAIGRMGAEHFLRLGFRSLVYFGPDQREFARTRRDGFQGHCTAVAATCHTAMTSLELPPLLQSLPKPIGVMACNDRAGLAALHHARSLGMKVPDDVAVLGVDNDDLVQSIAFPPLSSINTARERIGFEAASLLDKLISGASAPKVPIAVQPIGIISRLSTSTLAISDADVSEAARFIHANAVRRIGVDDVARSVSVSRRQLERRFRTTLGRSIHDEIVRVRLDQARRLLATTHLTLEQVSAACGFSSQSYFQVVFRRSLGSTPGAYRSLFFSRPHASA